MAVVVSSEHTEKNKCSAKGIVYLLMTFAFNGMIMLCQKAYPRLYPQSSSVPFSFMTFSFTFIICMAVSLIDKKSKSPISGKLIVPAIAVGIGLCGINQMSMVLAGIMSAALQFPVQTTLTLLLTTIVSVIAFKEKVSIKKLTGIALCIAGVFYNAM